MALAKALVSADDDTTEDPRFDIAGISLNGQSSINGIEDLGDHVRF
jgi:hypothetical protein